MHDNDDQILPPIDENRPFGVPDFEDDEDAPTDVHPVEPAVSIHRVKPKVLGYERGMKRFYVQAANALDSPAPDLTSALGHMLCVVAVCTAKYYRAWPLIGEDGDEEVVLAARRVDAVHLRKNAALILECIADEIHAASCAIEALIVLDLLRQDLPAGIDNMPERDLCRALTERVWELYGSIPGYTERHTRRDGK